MIILLAVLGPLCGVMLLLAIAARGTFGQELAGAMAFTWGGARDAATAGDWRLAGRIARVGLGLVLQTARRLLLLRIGEAGRWNMGNARRLIDRIRDLGRKP